MCFYEKNGKMKFINEEMKNVDKNMKNADKKEDLKT